VRRRRAPGAQTDLSFRNWLKELRERAGLTQDELAAAVGTDRRNIRRWEAEGHDPSGTVLLRMLDALGAEIVPKPPDELPRAVNAEVHELRTELAEAEERAAARHDQLLERLETFAGDLRLLSADLTARKSPNG
jgi:transcriptional regulator with XRE-family HTH domain